MRTLRSGCAAALLTALIAAPARAAEQPESLPAARPQTPVFAPTSLERFVRGAVPRATGQTDGAAARQPKRDSILNGVLIGAAIGGVGGSALIVASSGGSADIARAMWNVSLLPTLAGAAAGAVIDALR